MLINLSTFLIVLLLYLIKITPQIGLLELLQRIVLLNLFFDVSEYLIGCNSENYYLDF